MGGISSQPNKSTQAIALDPQLLCTVEGPKASIALPNRAILYRARSKGVLLESNQNKTKRLMSYKESSTQDLIKTIVFLSFLLQPVSC